MYFRRSLSCIRTNRTGPPWFLPTSAPLSIYFHGTLSSFYQRGRGLKWANGETVKRRETKGGRGTINDQSRILNDSNETLYSSFFFSRILPLDIERVKRLLSEEEMENYVSPLTWFALSLSSSKIITSLIKLCAFNASNSSHTYKVNSSTRSDEKKVWKCIGSGTVTSRFLEWQLFRFANCV